MKKNTKPAQSEKKVASLFTLTPADMKAIHGGGGVITEGPRKP